MSEPQQTAKHLTTLQIMLWLETAEWCAHYRQSYESHRLRSECPQCRAWAIDEAVRQALEIETGIRDDMLKTEDDIVRIAVDEAVRQERERCCQIVGRSFFSALMSHPWLRGVFDDAIQQIMEGKDDGKDTP